jgi:AcrR family transcriptional regulator
MRGRKSNKEVRRDGILDVALRHFGRFGYRKASLVQIAEELGVVKGALYYYFPDGKRSLFDAVAGRAEAQVLAAMRQAAERAPGAREALGAICEAKLRVLRELRDVLGVESEVADEIVTLVRRREHPFVRAERELLEDLLARGAREGVFRELPSRRDTAAALQSLLRGPALEVLHAASGSRGSRRLAPAALELLLRGLEARP